MGLGRMLWRSTGIGRTIDTVKNMVEEGSVIEGVKKTAKEDWCEDNPITSRVYERTSNGNRSLWFNIA